MAIDVCAEINFSPRISFSYDLTESDRTFHQFNSSSTSDSASDFAFDFANGRTADQELFLSSADQLFSNGKILPMQIMNNNQRAEKKKLKELLLSANSDEEVEEEPRKTGILLAVGAEYSLKCENVRCKRLFRLLSRSNSTGSSSLNQKDQSKKQHLKKQSSVSSRKSESMMISGSNISSQKSWLKKNYGAYCNDNGVRISPVLNLPPSYISRASVSLFGFGSLFNRNAKEKKR